MSGRTERRSARQEQCRPDLRQLVREVRAPAQAAGADRVVDTVRTAHTVI
ncbi:hypothetical protein [Streptomyces diastatochromogenes]